MSLFALRSALSASEKIERRRLMVSDTLALVTLFAITSLLALLTNFLYQSYASHQVVLANRWLARGEDALRAGKPQIAVDALSSALAFAPSQRSTEIKLAQALASAGRVQEATVYFNALLESQQGDGFINLQLAELAARQGNRSEAIQEYQRAIYGNWEGDGYVRRREVRFELIHYLISQGLLDQARSELLMAQGNAPSDDISLLLQIARTMEQAVDPSDALHLYKTILRRHTSLREALEGAGGTAFQLGHYLEAKRFLGRLFESPGIDQEPAAALEPSRERLREASRLLLLFPSLRLSVHERSSRLLNDRKIAKARWAQCNAQATSEEAKRTAVAAPAGKTASNPLESFASRFSRRPKQAATNQVGPAVDPLQSLAARWQQSPEKLTVGQLEKDPELADAQLQLVYDTEITTRQVCGDPTGDDDLLLRIAEAPNRVEEE